jgi:Domain of unknown function (DUF4157)
MTARTRARPPQATLPTFIPARRGLLQRKCACGNQTIAGGSCEECSKKKRLALQTKLTVNEPGDTYEQEADRIADWRLAALSHSEVGAALRIQRFSGQPSGQIDAAPASVDQALASPGIPLDPALRHDMEGRFGHDFSRVRVHTGGAAEKSARDINSHAYTVQNSIVFGAGEYAPGSDSGRRLIAHELTHIVQQFGSTNGAVQRQVNPQQAQEAGDQPPLFTVFVADPRKRSDKRFARQQGQADTARIQKSGTLSLEDRQLVNAKLRFFEGEAKDAYVLQVKPALVQSTRPEIEMHPTYVGQVPIADPVERERIGKRRERTYRFFSKVKDNQLKEAYISRLQRYLDEGLEANAYWDVETIEQIIAERAPNAPWHKQAREDFLVERAIKLLALEREKRLPTLPPYWQNQFRALAEQTPRDWPEGLSGFAQNLLWKWHDQVAKYDDNPYMRDVIQAPVAEEMIFNNILSQYEVVLRDRDRAIQDECRRDPPGRLMKVWGDPCKPWFGESAHRGEHEMSMLRLRMRLRRDKDRVPYRDIIYSLEEYKNAAGALPTRMGEAHLEILQSWSTVQGGLAMAARPMKGLPAAGGAARPTAPIATASTPKTSWVGRMLRSKVLAAAMRGAEMELPTIASGGGVREAPSQIVKTSPTPSGALTPAPPPRTPATVSSSQAAPSSVPSRPVAGTTSTRAAAQPLVPIPGAQEVRVTPQQYQAALGHTFPSHSFDFAYSLADSIGQQAAQVAMANPRFVAAVQNGNMTLAGTFFHSAAATVARRLPASAVPAGWRLQPEFTIQAGRGGSRADILLRGPNGEIFEFDWKTSGPSALSTGSRREMQRHAGQITANIGGNLSRQESRSWIDFVRTLWPNAPWP